MMIEIDLNNVKTKNNDFEFITTKNNIKVIKINEFLYYIKSKNKISTFYRVYFDRSLTRWICNCKNFGIHLGQKQRCYHLKAVDEIVTNK